MSDLSGKLIIYGMVALFAWWALTAVAVLLGIGRIGRALLAILCLVGWGVSSLPMPETVRGIVAITAYLAFLVMCVLFVVAMFRWIIAESRGDNPRLPPRRRRRNKRGF